jgi:hypothetical protein
LMSRFTFVDIETLVCGGSTMHELLIAAIVPGKRHHTRVTHIGPHHHAAPLACSLPGERCGTKLQSVHNQLNTVNRVYIH